MKLQIVVVCLVAMWVGALALAEEQARIKVLVVTGGHGFEEGPFFKVFEDNPQMVLTAAKHGKDADVYDRQDLLSYDVVVLYDMPKTITAGQQASFLSLFDKGIGLGVLHHALVSFQDWPEYERIIGGRYPEQPGKSGVVTPE